MKFKTFIITLVILLTFASVACGRTTVNIDDLGLITGPEGIYGRLTTLAQIVVVVGANSTTVIVNREITAVTQNVPISVQLKFTNAGAINVAPGQTVTFLSDTSQIIAGGDTADIFVGTGAIIFAMGGTVWPDWWEYNAAGVTNMSVALQAAINSINVPNGGNVYYNGATYVVENIETYGNIAHHGVYGATTLKRPDVPIPGIHPIMHVNAYDGGTADPADNEKNILIEDIIFHGNSDVLGFNQSYHNLEIAAASFVTIQRCQFIYPRGDGIILDVGTLGILERHNEDIKILYNFFDGWDGGAVGGRNAISVYDCVNLDIIGNKIIRTGTVGMPGGIDIEPYLKTWTRLTNITIADNEFYYNTRSLIQISLNGADTYTLHPAGFKILNNYADGTNTEAVPTMVVRFWNNDAPYLVSATDMPNGVIIDGNQFYDRLSSTCSIRGTKGTIIRNNTWYNMGIVILGEYQNNISENNYDLIVDSNIFEVGGNIVGLVSIGNNDILQFTNNIFRDPNLVAGTGQHALSFFGDGVITASSYVIISGNFFGGTMIEAVDVGSHNFTPETNRWFGNTVIPGVTNDFLYDSPDDNMAWGDYDFTVDGGVFGVEYVLGQLPDNARITRAWYQIIDAFTSGGLATVRLGVQGDDNDGIQDNLDFDDAEYAAGWHDGDPDGAVANMTVITTDFRNVIMTILIANLTAGHIRVWWEYVVGE